MIRPLQPGSAAEAGPAPAPSWGPQAVTGQCWGREAAGDDGFVVGFLTLGNDSGHRGRDKRSGPWPDRGPSLAPTLLLPGPNPPPPSHPLDEIE